MPVDQHAGAISRIILLTGEVEAPVLADILRLHNPALKITAVTTSAGLAEAFASATAGTRLLSFCSAVIVPGELLAALPGPSYNFHPGPPERPGRYPSIFALFEGDTRFGITVHEMLASVDSGAIIAAEWFDVPAPSPTPETDLEALDHLTLMHLLASFRRLARDLALKPEPLRRQMIGWQGRKTTKADCDALCATTPNMSAGEVARRRRACGPYLLRKIQANQGGV